MESTDLSGSLLVATPQIEEGVFARSVVLLLHHDAEGAQGVVLNRPLDARVDAVLPDWQPHVTAPATLFEGGPVGLDSALGLVTGTTLLILSFTGGGAGGSQSATAPTQLLVGPGFAGLRGTF